MESSKLPKHARTGTAKRRIATIALSVALFAFAFPSRAAEPTYWQVILNYGPSGVVVEEAAEIAPMTKHVTTPGLKGAPAVLDYDVEWLDGQGKALVQSKAEIPLGQIVGMSPGAACARQIPSEGLIVIRIEGPAPGSKPNALALRKSGATRLTAGAAAELPAPFRQDALSLPIQRVTPAAALPPPGPRTATKIHDTGPDSNRLVIVVMGDGYTDANLTSGLFTTDADNLVTAFEAKSLWNDYFNGANVYRVDVESNQEGADRSESSSGPLVDTYFNSTFWTSGIERLLTINSTGQNRAISAANSKVGTGVWDAIFIVVNTPVYGGSGGQISVCSTNEFASEVIIHEFGHTFAGLADEYSDPYPGYPPGDSEPNVDFNASGAGLKWLAWVENDTPLPTPQTQDYSEVIGTFLGARYLESGIYRPKLNCLMRALGVDFCSVCKEANIQSFFDIVNLTDSVTPASGANVTVTAAGADFSVAPLPISTVEYEWTLAGELINGASGPSLHLTTAGLTTTAKQLRLVVWNPTPLVRIQPLETQTFTWNVKSDGSLTPNRSTGDFDGDGCTGLSDSLFLLDHWFTISPLGGAQMDLPDFLALLDNWGTGCP